MSDELKWVNPTILPDLVPKHTGDATFKIPTDIDGLIFMAKLTEQAERYDEMVLCMRSVVKLNAELSSEERNLLSVAYKNVIGPRRNQWRIISSIEERAQSATETLQTIQMLRKQLEVELAAICDDLLQLLDTYLIPAAVGGEAKVFYLKMKGDYHRYYAETAEGDTQKQLALESYEQAMQVASTSLAPTQPIRLGLVLNFSVFYYEIMKQHETGLKLAREAYADAVNELEALDEDAFRESTLIVQLLRDNLNLWTEERNSNAN